MTHIDIHDLSANLREVLGRASSGETIVLVDGAKIVADLVPHSATQAAVRAAVARGEMRWSGGKPKGLRGITARGESMSETVIRARG